MVVLQFLADVFGWIYLGAWGFLPYPQILLNFRLKSVEGFKLDYPFLNLTGFFFLSITYSVGYFEERNDFHENYGFGKIVIHDLIYCYHGIFYSIILTAQCFTYPRGKNKISILAWLFTVVAWVSCLIFYLFSQVFHLIPFLQGFNVYTYMALVKVATNIARGPSLIFWNWKRQSTEGLSPHSLFLSILGGLSIVMQDTLMYFLNGKSALNVPKLSLGALTAFIDIILLYQCFCLYRVRRKKKAYSNKSNSLNDTLSSVQVLDKTTSSTTGL